MGELGAGGSRISVGGIEAEGAAVARRRGTPQRGEVRNPLGKNGSTGLSAQAQAARHRAFAIATLRRIAADRTLPATARVSACAALLARSDGKPAAGPDIPLADPSVVSQSEHERIGKLRAFAAEHGNIVTITREDFVAGRTVSKR